jgi:O-methyltransferase
MELLEILELVKVLPEGDYAECGVFQGDTAEIISKNRADGATLWLFDSFEGHADPHPFDDAVAHPKGRYSNTHFDLVARKITEPFYVVAGWLPDTLEVVDQKRFRFVHVDVDHYLPTKGVTEFFLSRMVPGGILKFDDYGHPECPGATKAIDELLGDKAKERYFRIS